QLPELSRIFHGANINRGLYRARSNAHDQDVVGRKLDSGRAREHPHSPFCKTIGSIARHRPVLVDRRDVDNAPTSALLDHLLGGDLSAEESAFEVNSQYPVVLLLRRIEDRGARFDAGVVHHDVEPPEMGDSRVDKLVQIVDLADVCIDADGLAAELSDRLLQFRSGLGVNDIVDDETGGPLPSQLKNDGLTDSAVAAGDDRNLVLQ